MVWNDMSMTGCTDLSFLIEQFDSGLHLK